MKIARRASEHPPPQSFAQQRLWVLDRIEGHSAAYNVGLCVRGDMGRERLQEALDAIVARHEPLRTTLAERDGIAVQIVHGPAPIGLPAIDDAEAFGMRPFDLAAEWPMRAAIVSHDRTVTLVLVFHHSAVDRWSFDVLLRELTALLRGETLPPLPITYGDYAVWQRESFQHESLHYWQQRLDGAPALLNLPTDRPRRATRRIDGAVESFRIEPRVAAELGRIGATHGATPFMTLLAALDVLLARWSGDLDITVGCPVANREAAETHDLIGFFVNTIVLRADLTGDPAFTALLQRLRARWVVDLEHRNAPFEKVVERLRPERSLGHNPLFQLLFQFEPASAYTLDADGLSLEVERLELPVSIFDLTLELQERDGGLWGRLEYRTDLFAAETARRLCAQYAQLLRSIAEAPETRISRLTLEESLECAGRSRRFRMFSRRVNIQKRQLRLPHSKTLVSLFERVAARRPDAIALIANGRVVSYRELSLRSNALAQRLSNVRGDGPIAVELPRSAELVIALLG